ncbi:linker histone H1 and H5 family-domain-containing protein [Endogone sp. FLAS-F59071]|nr:linker histone H1 and H5 family-domain-containing protein [Endogone sp. FLAS-F59071]|eukprot:RUS17634.1 linker histone H1 and H5 family-domain-containing protein [Endogone sp. FLAS-F59071]
MSSTKPASAKAAKKADHPSYEDMVKDSIIALKDRKGSSRPAIKKYILANYNGLTAGAHFDVQVNNAIRKGVEKGIFSQPKGASGTLKLAKPAAAEKKDKKEVSEKEKSVKKDKKEKKAVAKKPATKKVSAAKAAKASKVVKAKIAKKAAAKPTTSKPKKATTITTATKPKKAIMKAKKPKTVEKAGLVAPRKKGTASKAKKTAAAPKAKKAAPKKKTT